jgi:nucleoside-diphosphate-sugar epimerase
MSETLLLTGAASPLGLAAAAALERERYRLRPTDAVDLTDPDLAAGLVRGVDAIVHLAPWVLVDARANAAGGDLLDAAARGTHVLYRAALQAGVTRAVQASTLAVMDAYPDELEVTEQWRPRPRPEPRHLAPYLAELVAREFARDPQLEVPLAVVCLRLADADDLPLADAARALARAVAWLREGGRPRGRRFQLFHVADPSPTARYSSALAQRTLGYGRVE